ncbi:MAG: N-acetyltransferase [Bacteroidetes bacterium]|nr:N-acetyltransferase [Bacteroidota bacterium]
MHPPDPSTIQKNDDRRRFQWTVDGHTAYTEFLLAGDRFYVTHTEVPRSLEGRGIGSALIQHVLEWIDHSGLKLVPLCPFTAAYLQRHPEWKRLLAEGYSV